MKSEVYYRQLANYENHWWFKSREIIIKYILKKNLNKSANILDFGCGAGNNLNMLSEFGNVWAYDTNQKILNILKKKNYNKRITFIKNLDKTNKRFDLIIATDVIEHIEDDKKIIDKFYKILKNKGSLLITVPAYNFLFSTKDKDLHHKRRYTKSGLKIIFENKFDIKIFSYYNFFLFFPIASAILFFKFFRINFINKVEKKQNILINYIMLKIFSFERFIINHFTFPFGISIIFFGKKK
jgi:SAM-dependent methyltransferase